MDRVFINEALKGKFTYNPDGVADGGAYTGLTEPPKFDVTTDLLTVVERLRSDNVPTFADGNYRCLASPRFMKHLRANSDFREVARYPGFGDNFQPNQLIFGGPQFQQANFVNMAPTMP